jgi:nitrogen fixation NifU-like protein
MNDDQLYRENLMDHYKNPRNKGSLPNATTSSVADNPFCGDSLKVDLVVTNGIITDFKFDGDMCAVGIAAGSMLSEQIIGLSLADAKDFSKEALLAFFSKDLTTSRVKCATLALEALHSAIKNYENTK